MPKLWPILLFLLLTQCISPDFIDRHVCLIDQIELPYDPHCVPH